ncbi:MAG: hypothetical protein ABJA35_11395 [Parafilimonas sp.]
MKKNIFLTAFIATSLMTGFSYIISSKQKKKFEEPEILGQLLHRLSPKINKENAMIAGWLMHYSIGIVFVIVYELLFKKYKLKRNFITGFYIGALSGLLAIIIWHATLKLHPNPPSVDLKKYYIVLMAAHILFGIDAITTLNARTKRMRNENSQLEYNRRFINSKAFL